MVALLIRCECTCFRDEFGLLYSALKSLVIRKELFHLDDGEPPTYQPNHMRLTCSLSSCIPSILLFHSVFLLLLTTETVKATVVYHTTF